MDAKKILLIDDSADDNALTKRALKKSKILNELIIIEEGKRHLTFYLATIAKMNVRLKTFR